MRHLQHNSYLLVVLALACLAAQTSDTDAQDWRGFLDNASRRLRDTSRDVQQEWRQSERRCRSCGKTIHGQDTCTACMARRSAEKARQSHEKARQVWQETAPQRREIITRTREAADSARRKWDESEQSRRDLSRRTVESVHRARQMTEDVHRKYQEMSPHLRVAREHAIEWLEQRSADATRHCQIARNEYGPRIVAAIQDPNDQRKAMEAVGAMLEARRQFGAVKYEVAYHSIKLAGQIRVDTAGGPKTLEQIAQDRLAKAHPYLSGTPIVDDPAAPLAHLITADRKYFVNEMPLIESGGRRLPIRQAMIQASPFDADETIRCLSLLEAADEVSHAIDCEEGCLDAMESVLVAMENLNRSSER